jgi:L-ascorbate metabolism protein UlaG (beta-lactamase superfamily)
MDGERPGREGEDTASGAGLTFLGHASVLVELGGARVLTDPMLRPRVGHLLRRVEPPDPAALAGLDAVLISHAHHDHLDLPSLRRIPGAPRVLAPAAAKRPLRRSPLRVEPMRAGGSARVGGLEVTAVFAEHHGRRWPLAGSTESLGFLLESGEEGERGCRVYFAGDTDLFGGLEGLAERVDVALLPISGWGQKVGAGHMDPDAAAEAAAILRPRLAVPIHWGTYSRVGMDSSAAVLREPAERFRAQVVARAPGVEVVLLAPGESLPLSPA